jgi:hypothetical protein
MFQGKPSRTPGPLGGVDVMPRGHVGYMERPDEVTQAITPFLLRLN